MTEYTIYAMFIFGMFFLLFRDAEKLRWLGGEDDEDIPIKDGTFWFFFWVSIIILKGCILQIWYLLYIAIYEPSMLALYSHQFFGIGILFVLVFVLLFKGFINPSINFFITLGCNIFFTIIFWSIYTGKYPLYVSPIFSLIVSVIIAIVLKRYYKAGNKILWELPPKYWKKMNNKWFLLVFTILFAIEMYFQIFSESITTFFI
ncbi:MAG: hypothetical protein ACTSRI_18610 [Promethearchaeota archaeon]